ncbi:hypothetical protein IEQ34_001756 [Dendrobium chrysotoxum]|uniref:Uncharacterized protein n=1 Tax=Dendrobium chrysotoxum TaxID=161865 RepID=A0AAV7HRH9_DENCH|nr:hypothetical protein IEQ34_001756 [Dendrobium chrysotoxum]
MPPGTRIHIEVNENNISYNIPEYILLGSYLSVVARDPFLAPIAFPDWRNKGMESFKKNMLAGVEPGKVKICVAIALFLVVMTLRHMPSKQQKMKELKTKSST